MPKGRGLTPQIAEDLDTILSAPLPWERFAGKTVLIAGAGGFLPAWMVWTLARLNARKTQAPCRIIGLVRNAERARGRLGHLLSDPNVHLIEADIGTVAVEDLLRLAPIHFMIHAASAAAPAQYLQDPTGALLANIVGIHTLLELSRRGDPDAILYLSSGEVYGETGSGVITEDDYGYLDPTKVRSCYGEAKRAAEAMCVAHHAQFGTPCKIVRPLHTYGPGIDLGDGRVFSDFIASIIARRDILLKSDGAARRPFCYVSDATIGFFTVLLKGEDAIPYMVGNPNTLISVRDLAWLLTREAFPKLGISVQFAKDGEQIAASPISGSMPDISRVSELGWRPSTSLIEGFRRTVASFQHTC